LEHLHSIDHVDAELASDSSCVYVAGNDILSRTVDIPGEQVDSEGLLVLDKFVAVGDGFIKQGPYLLVPHRCFRQSYSLHNHLNSEFFGALARAHREHPKLKVSIRLDGNVVGIPESLQKYEELDYWWGPKYKKNPNEIEYGEVVHGPTQHDIAYGRLKQTEFWWYGKERRTFEAEEVMEHPAKLIVAGQDWFAMRFVHSIFDPETKRPCHLDGAVRLYDDELFGMRKEKTIGKFGKLAERLKLWRVDGDMAVETWFTLINTFFRNNFSVAEYFGFSWEDVK